MSTPEARAEELFRKYTTPFDAALYAGPRLKDAIATAIRQAEVDTEARVRKECATEEGVRAQAHDDCIGYAVVTERDACAENVEAHPLLEKALWSALGWLGWLYLPFTGFAPVRAVIAEYVRRPIRVTNDGVVKYPYTGH